MTPPPREPFFKPEDSDMSYRDAMAVKGLTIEKANRLVEPLLEKIHVLETEVGYRRVESEMSFVEDLKAENERLKLELEDIKRERDSIVSSWVKVTDEFWAVKKDHNNTLCSLEEDNEYVEKLKAEAERLRADVKKLCDENGNEYVQVAMLKEKIRELRAELEQYKQDVVRSVRECATLETEIEQAPVVTGRKVNGYLFDFKCVPKSNDTHTARLVDIKEIKNG